MPGAEDGGCAAVWTQVIDHELHRDSASSRIPSDCAQGTPLLFKGNTGRSCPARDARNVAHGDSERCGGYRPGMDDSALKSSETPPRCVPSTGRAGPLPPPPEGIQPSGVWRSASAPAP